MVWKLACRRTMTMPVTDVTRSRDSSHISSLRVAVYKRGKKTEVGHRINTKLLAQSKLQPKVWPTSIGEPINLWETISYRGCEVEDVKDSGSRRLHGNRNGRH